MKLSDYIIDFLAAQGVKHVFEFIGGAITHLIDSVHGRQDISCISVHHEQTGAFAAEAYARINGRLGVAMATSGPGALNMVTGIGSCYFDSVPCLFITGQVNTYEYKFDKPVRQVGFQETDIVSVIKPISKYAEMVLDPLKIRYNLEKATFLAQSGRPGPVLLDIPMNIQRTEVDPESLESFYDSDEFKSLQKLEQIHEDVLDKIIEMLYTAERPVILVGGGIRSGNSAEELQKFIYHTGAPVVSSLMGLDAMPHDYSGFFGLIGSYGNRFSNLAVANCDLLMILGSRLDTRQTGTSPETFARCAKKIHVDVDSNELGAKMPVDVAVHANIKDFLININKKIMNKPQLMLPKWLKVLNDYKEKYPTISKLKAKLVEPNHFMMALSNCTREGDIVCVDVGQHQMWAAQSFKLKSRQRMLNSGGMGAMGFALPAAIGAAKASPENRAIVIAGDGGIQVNIQELELIARNNLPVKMIVMNNNCLGMVRQFQDIYFNGRQQSTVLGYGCPDFIKVAKAYGIPAFTIKSGNQMIKKLKSAIDSAGPVLINVLMEQGTVVSPKLIVNRPIEDMYPFLERDELKKLMLIELDDSSKLSGT